MPEPNNAAGQTGRARARFTRAMRLAAFAALCAAAAMAASFVFGAATYRWSAFDVEVRLRPALAGETRLVLTPLGEVRARTHRAPVAVHVALLGVSFDEVRSIVAHARPRERLEQSLERRVRADAARFAWRQVTVSALGALAVPLLLRRRRARWWLAAPVLGAACTAAVMGMAIRTFDRSAFENPTYVGSLRQADWAMAMAREAFAKADALSERLRRVAANVETLYGRLNAVPGLAADVETIKVLHISDLHNNPAAIDFVQELAARMRVDLVIDTGDLTDFGTPVESGLSRMVGRLPAPYLFLAGNHDSLATEQAVRRHPNALVLETGVVRAAGLRILAAPDPASRRPGAGSVDTTEEALRQAGEEMARMFDEADPPDIVAVHNPRQAQPLLGRARVVLAGHMHYASIEEVDGTLVCNAGTTGGAGARYFDRREGVPFTAELLYFTRDEAPRLLFVDQVKLDGGLGRYSIERHTVHPAPRRPGLEPMRRAQR